MSSVPPNQENLSLKLTEVLSELGVNDDMVMRRRECALFCECVIGLSTCTKLSHSPTSQKLYHSFSSQYLFGSQSEGSTTIGINSDDDVLFIVDTHHVIHDSADWKLGVTNVLMVQDETTASGYCLLQLLRDDAPLAANICPYTSYKKDANGKVLLKNTMFDMLDGDAGFENHGPAKMPRVKRGVRDTDYVHAFHCDSWPIEASRWVYRQNKGGLPSDRLKSECKKAGCFLVPVGSKVTGLDELEWRVSTSVAERYLMFSLNVTHLHCYVLMKMILQSYYVFEKVISSYMCKTVLFHCIENSSPEFWQEHNLIPCLHQSLRVLYNFIYHTNCPHFIIPENNLMAGRTTAEQQHSLLEVIQHMIRSDGRMLFEIHTDNLGDRLHMKMGRLILRASPVLSSVEINRRISTELCFRSARTVLAGSKLCLLEYFNDDVSKAVRHFLRYFEYIKGKQQLPHSSYIQQTAYSCVLPLLSSTIGSLLATYYLTINQPLPNELILSWFMLGLNSDVGSGWLKLATASYSLGGVHTEAILRYIERQYGRHAVTPVCACYPGLVRYNQRFGNVADQTKILDFRRIVSYCVMFMPCELSIAPKEMIPEFIYRSSNKDLLCRDKIYDNWMDLAVVDSLPYLYFLQYKTYGRLRNHTEQRIALHKLQRVIYEEQNLSHRETALNLFGLCLEQENLPDDAFHCYHQSRQVRPRINAANFHLSRFRDSSAKYWMFPRFKTVLFIAVPCLVWLLWRYKNRGSPK